MNLNSEKKYSQVILKSLIAGILCFGRISFAAADLSLEAIKLPQYIYSIKLPPVLFHWTSDEGLKSLTPDSKTPTHINDVYPSRYPEYSSELIGRIWKREEISPPLFIQSEGDLPLPELEPRTIAKEALPMSYGLTSFADPIVAMGTDLEIFADAKYKVSPFSKGIRGIKQRVRSFVSGLKYYNTDAGREIEITVPARVLTMQTNPNAKIDIMVTSVSVANDSLGSITFVNRKFIRGIDNPDFIFHVHLNTDGSIRFQQWLVLNAKMITSYTADPKQARPYIEERLKKYQNVNYKISEAEKGIFARPPYHMREILQSTLASELDGPEDFLSIFNKKSVIKNCQHYYITH